MFPIIHKPLQSNKVRYSNHHLQPFRVVLIGHGHNGGNIVVRFSYHSHVYSIDFDPTSIEVEFLDERGKPRSFCPIRHSLSNDLPAICSEMITQNFLTWISADRNKKSNLTITDGNPTSGLRYLIYYSVGPSLATGLDIEIVIKSAYEKVIDMADFPKREKIRQIIKKSYFKRMSLPK